MTNYYHIFSLILLFLVFCWIWWSVAEYVINKLNIARDSTLLLAQIAFALPFLILGIYLL